MEIGKDTAADPRIVDLLMAKTAEEMVRFCERIDCAKCRMMDGMKGTCKVGYPAYWPPRAMDVETGNGAGTGWKVRDMTAAELIRFCRVRSCEKCPMRDGLTCIVGYPGGWPAAAMEMDLERDRRKEGDGHGG